MCGRVATPMCCIALHCIACFLSRSHGLNEVPFRAQPAPKGQCSLEKRQRNSALVEDVTRGGMPDSNHTTGVRRSQKPRSSFSVAKRGHLHDHLHAALRQQHSWIRCRSDCWPVHAAGLARSFICSLAFPYCTTAKDEDCSMGG